jgi:hypothetical protein
MFLRDLKGSLVILIDLLISHNPGRSPLSSFNPPAVRDEPKQVWCQRQRQQLTTRVWCYLRRTSHHIGPYPGCVLGDDNSDPSPAAMK